MDFVVEGMTCQHCVRAVTDALAAVPGVATVAVDLPTGRVSVTGQPDPTALREAVTAEGYGIR